MKRINAKVATLCFLCAGLAGCSDDDAPDASASGLEVLDPTAAHHGKSYSEWNAEWFKWVYQTQYDDNCQLPLDDPNGQNCAVGQAESDVFFLAGNIADDTTVIVRDSCVVPAGKPLFFPLMNSTADNGGTPADQQLTPDDLQASVEDFLNKVEPENLFASVDGEEIPDLERFKTEIVEFSYELPDEPNFYSCLGASGVTGTIDPAYAGGYYVMVGPLSPGAHEVRFGLDQPSTLWTSDITYELTVE